ncbi:MAG TPA: DUF4340 domain-containing protein [Candidatus Binataceae bacterium]|nr:DUF4340 domain-containing protein [Candidatus Binataceae bacterium]
MSFRNTIIALAVLIVIGGYALYVGKFSQPAEQTQKLMKIDSADIAKIDLKYPDREIQLERKKGGTWMITRPIGADADQTAANNLARAIADCQLVKTVDDKPADLAPFGLVNPNSTVTITTFDGKTLPGIEIGKTTPIGFNAYIKTTDKPAVMLTQAAFQSGMNKTLSELRDRDLMTFKAEDVQKLELIKDDGTTIEIDRNGDNWKIVKPAPYKADDTVVREAISELVNAKVADFITDTPSDVAKFGLEKPHATITVYLKDGTQQSLLFGFKQTESGKDGIYVRRGERAPVYTVHEYVMSGVNRSLLDFRDKTVFAFDPAAVDSINVKETNEQFTIKRAPGGKWEITAGGKTSPGDVADVERFLDQIRDLKGNSIVADPMPSFMPFGMNAPAIDIALSGKDGRPLGEIKLSKISVTPTSAPAPGEQAGPRTDYYATSSAGKAVYSVSDYYFTQLNRPARLLMEQTAAASPAASSSAK